LSIKFKLIRPLKRLLPHFDPFIIFQSAVSLFFFIFLLILPLSSIVLRAFLYKGSFSLYWFQSILTNKYFLSLSPKGGKLFEIYGDTLYVWGLDYGIILNSLIIALTVATLCSILGIVTAYIMAKYEFPGKTVLRIGLNIPMLATPFVNAYVLSKLFHPKRGIINVLLYDILHILPYRVDVNGFAGIILAQTLSYFPIVYLNVLSSIISIDPSLEEQAENLGAKGFTLFRKIILPLSLPGIMAGFTVTFIFSMEDLGAPIGFIGYSGNPLAKKVMSYYIFQSFSEALRGQISPETATLSIILLILSLSGFMLIKKYVSLRTYATISKGSRWSSKVKKPRRIGLLLILAFIIPLVIFASLPQVGVFILAFTDWVTSGIFPSKLTFEYVNQLLTPSVRTAMFNSLTYSILAVLIAVFIGSNASYVVSRVKSSIANILDILSTIPISIPGIVLAVGFFLFFTSYFRGTVLDPLVDPSILLILAYSIRRLPFAARSIFAGLQQVHISLEEAAMNLGANRLHTFIRIVLPLISINIFGGAILTFVYSMSEVSTSVTLGSLRGDRGPITFYISQVVYGSVVVGAVSVGAALCVLLILLQVMAISISNYLLKQRFSIFGM